MRWIAGRQVGVQFGVGFPSRGWRLLVRYRYVFRCLFEAVVMDVPRAIPVDLVGMHPDDELRAGVGGQQLIVLSDLGLTLNANPSRVLEVDEQQAEVGVLPEVAHRQVLAVAVVVRECEPVVINHPNEPAVTAFVRAGGDPAVIAGSLEKHVGAFYELACRVVERMRCALSESVGKTA